VTLALFAILPVYSGLSHWFHSEQRNHWFGYWFGHDMFTPPFVGPDGQLTYDASLREAAAKGPKGMMVYPEMARDAVLFGGTDPGRFCPTYTIFCESFIPHDCQPEQDQHYDRRDVYIITQNALADNTYLDYIRAQYNRSTQLDPPFFQNFLSGSLPSVFHGPMRILAPLDEVFEGIGAKVEKRRRTSTSSFHPDQFTKVEALAAKLRQEQDPLSAFLYGKLSPETQQLTQSGGDTGALSRGLSKDLNAVLEGSNIYSPERFKNITLPPLIQEAVSGGDLLPNNVIRLNRRMLEEGYPDAIVKSLGGVYPDTEIQTPSPDDLRQSSADYGQDAARRWQHDRQFPNEPRQIQPGEDVQVMPNGQVQFGGEMAVFGVNGLLAKTIFDRSPEHEFYVEESVPLQWMYPYLSPFGIIMKINREPVEITQAITDKDHAFWSEYCGRSIGNWITYDTGIKEICAWAEEVYLRHNFSHFSGDEKFIRDDDAQKAFCKLRSAIGSSIYEWRWEHASDAEARARSGREAEFAFKQAFAFCPYSPDAAFHMIYMLVNQNRTDEALMILRTSHKLDPYNEQINQWIEQLSRGQTAKPADMLQQAFGQVQRAIAAHQTNAAEQMLQQLVALQGNNPNVLMGVAASYVQMNDLARSEEAIVKLTEVTPNSSGAWYNLGIIQAHRGEISQAIASAKKSLALNAEERARDPSAVNLRQHLFEDAPFAELRRRPEFQAAFGTKP
jgi:Flp pilus assembly protein TadD